MLLFRSSQVSQPYNSQKILPNIFIYHSYSCSSNFEREFMEKEICSYRPYTYPDYIDTLLYS
jgi:hypothetical protein